MASTLPQPDPAPSYEALLARVAMLENQMRGVQAWMTVTGRLRSGPVQPQIPTGPPKPLATVTQLRPHGAA